MDESVVDRIRRKQKERQISQTTDVMKTTLPDGTEVWTKAPFEQPPQPVVESTVEIKNHVIIDRPGDQTPDILDEELLNQKKQEAMDSVNSWLQFSTPGLRDIMLNINLEIIIDDHTDNNGQAVQDVSFGQVWDYRDDPEGMEFWLDNGDGGLDVKAMRAKAQRIADEQADKARTRMERLGYVIQDLVTPQELAETRQAMGTTPNQEER